MQRTEATAGRARRTHPTDPTLRRSHFVRPQTEPTPPHTDTPPEAQRDTRRDHRQADEEAHQVERPHMGEFRLSLGKVTDEK